MTFEEEIVSIQDMAFFAIPACQTIGTVGSKEILWDRAGKVLVVNHHRGTVRAGKGGLCSQVRGVLEAVAEKLTLLLHCHCKGSQDCLLPSSSSPKQSAQTDRGSLSLTDELNIKPLTGKRDLDKESALNVIKNSDGQFNLEAAIQSVDTMSNELKKINVESQLLLCDLILNFNHPVKAQDSREAEENTWSLTD